MNVTRSGLKGVREQEVHVSYHWRLRSQFPHVGTDIILVSARHFETCLGTDGESLNQLFNFLPRCLFDLDLAAINMPEIL